MREGRNSGSREMRGGSGGGGAKWDFGACK